MVKKNPASDLKMKIYNESLSRGKYILKKIYIRKKKRNANLVIPIEKKSKDTQLVGQKRKKITFRAAKLQCKKCSIPSRAK